MSVLELKPNTSQKSFYNKALILFDPYYIELTSYNLKVATFEKATLKLKIKGFYSKTTLKHLKAFITYLNNDYGLSLDNSSLNNMKKYL
jgi:hypothetical protein